jgi:hypothetical protein
VEADALKERMLGLRVHRVLLVQDFLKLSFIVLQLLAPWIALNSCDFMLWLAFLGLSRVVLLAFVRVVVVVDLLVVVALGEALILLILLVNPPLCPSTACNIMVGTSKFTSKGKVKNNVCARFLLR